MSYRESTCSSVIASCRPAEYEPIKMSPATYVRMIKVVLQGDRTTKGVPYVDSFLHSRSPQNGAQVCGLSFRIIDLVGGLPR